jgi:nucleotide-binding universal stress UspA family protein
MDQPRMESTTATAYGTPSSTPSILVASAGEVIDRRVVERAVDLARQLQPSPRMYVLSIARIWGTALGLQHPGLYPTRREWRAQADLVEDAVKGLERRGYKANGRVVGSRHAAKTIANVAAAEGCAAIVIGARPVSGWRRLLRQDEAINLQRRSAVPVHLVDVSI